MIDSSSAALNEDEPISIADLAAKLHRNTIGRLLRFHEDAAALRRHRQVHRLCIDCGAPLQPDQHERCFICWGDNLSF